MSWMPPSFSCRWVFAFGVFYTLSLVLGFNVECWYLHETPFCGHCPGSICNLVTLDFAAIVLA